MLKQLPFVLIAFLALPAMSQEADTGGADSVTTGAELTLEEQLFHSADDVTLEDFHWIKRPLVVFADSPNDPRFVQQIELLKEYPQDLLARDVIVLTDSDPKAKSALRTKLRPRGFMMVLVGKDGNVYLRKPTPWDIREISRSIDKMPLRQQEELDRRAPNILSQ